MKEKTPDVADLNSILLAGYKLGGKATRLEATGDTFRTVEFEVFGPKTIGCISGLSGPLLERCIPIIMFRAPANSEKPKRRINANPERFQALGNSLHAMVLRYGAHIAMVAAESNVCPPEISGRNYELWHPLMALASWGESHGRQGLLTTIHGHAAETIAQQADEGGGAVEEIALKSMALLVQSGRKPIAKEILALARNDEPELFMRYTAKGIGTIRNRFGLRTTKSHGQRHYDIEMAALLRIQSRYGIDVGIPTDTPTCGNVPHVPACTPDAKGKDLE
ncbi:MAG: hypothetical protein ACP5I8_07110 [Phycisphaerae bacterium]